MLSDTLAKMDRLSKKDAPSLTSPALPLKKTKGEKLPSVVPLLKFSLKLLCQRWGKSWEEGKRKGKKDFCSLQTLLLQYSSPLAKKAGQQGWKKLLKQGKGKYASKTIIMPVFLDTHRTPDLGGHLLSHFLKTAGGLMQSIKSLQPESSHRQEWAELHCQQVQTDTMGRCALTRFLRVLVKQEHWKVNT